MSKGGSYGGGQSSLGYLFGSDDQKPRNTSPPAPVVTNPPYGTETIAEKPPISPSPSKQENVSNNYHRSQGQNSGNFITGRPSTKVKSVPGGDSSLGYLFGDK